MTKFHKTIKALITRRVEIDCGRIPHLARHVPYKKLFNWFFAETSSLIKPDIPLAWPPYLQIEPTTRCNLKCALCPVTDGLNRPTGEMDFNVFRKIIDEIGEYVFIIFLWDWGEPFLNPQIFQMISHAKRKGIKVVCSSNGHLFTQTEQVDKLVGSGLDTLIISLDGISQKTYEHYRRGGDLETVLQGIRTIVSHKRFLHSETPLVNLRFMVMKHNEHEIPELKKLAGSLGADVLTFKTLNTYFQETDPRNGIFNDLIPRGNRYQRFRFDRPGNRVQAHGRKGKELSSHGQTGNLRLSQESLFTLAEACRL